MALIIGHSQLKYFKNYLQDSSIRCIYSSGCTVEELTHLPCMKEAVPAASVIVVHCGINNLPCDSIENLLEKFQHLYDDLKELNPAATIVFSSILPRTTNQFRNTICSKVLNEINFTARQVNATLRAVAELDRYPDIVYLSHDPDFQPNHVVQTHMLSRDGLHLSFCGIETLVRRIESEIKAILSTPKPSSILPLMTASIEASPAIDHMCAYQSSADSNKKNQDDACVYYADSVPPETSTQPYVSKDKFKEKKSFETGCVPLHVLTTPWWISANSPNIFQNLSISDDDSQYYSDEDDNNFHYPVTLNGSRTPLTGGGAGNAVDGSHEEGDEFVSIVYSSCKVKLTHSEAAAILEAPDVAKVSNFPPFKPKGGTLYVISDGQSEKHKEDWRADGYTWRNYGKNKVTNGKKILEKSYFRIKNGKEESSNFQRVMVRLHGDCYNNLTLIQYLGDETEYKGEPHGNKKKGFRPYQRTLPSVIDKIKNSGNENPNSVKNKMDSEHPVPLKLTGIHSVRNTKQVENTQYNIRKDRKLGHDSLYNLHELVYHLDSYIHEIKTTPDLHVIVGHTDIFEEFDRLLQLKTNDPLSLYYDTTFCLGDFYVSTLAFQHIMFDENPVFPLAFMIHERKFQKCHEQFLDVLKEKIPRLGRKPVPIITDREAGIVNAIAKVLPDSPLLICWNHILRDLKFWLGKHGATLKDLQFYDNQVKQLLRCESQNEFEILVEKLKLPWSEPMTDYFEHNIRKTILMHAGRWILEEYDLYNPYSGVTNNCSESINAKLKRLTEWKEREVDNIVLFLYYMQSNDLADLMKSFCGLGEFKLHKKYKYAIKDPDTVILPRRVCHPDKMIEMIKGGLNVFDTERNNRKCPIEDDGSAFDSDTKRIEPNSLQQLTLPEKLNTKQKHSSPSKHRLSQKSLALETLNDHGITLVSEMKCFVVKGSRGQKYAVTLYPKETCQCPSTTRCRHILAATMAIGLEPGEDKKAINLTQLRKNSRARKDKKAGTKRGRKGDIENSSIIAAPDSMLMNDSMQENGLSFASDRDDKAVVCHSTPRSVKFLADPIEKNKSSPSNINCTPIQQPKTPKVVTFSPMQTPRSILKKSKKSLFEGQDPDIPDAKRIKFEVPSQQAHDLIEICNDELINISHSRNDNLEFEELPDQWTEPTNTSKTESFWLNDLDLKLSDKQTILNNEKLNSQIIEAINIIARNQFPTISGLQLPEKVPRYIPKESRWHIQQQAVMNQIPNDQTLAGQIHHTGKDHWVVSFRDETGSIFLFDSLGFERPTRYIMTPSLSIQLGLMYGKNTDQDLEVILIETQKQTNGVDCGLFAIAHLIEFCVNGALNPNAGFDTKKMRNHLQFCLESRRLSCFPTIPRRPTSRNRKITKQKSIAINLHCKCRLPDYIGDMVKCAACTVWYHKYCVSASIDSSGSKNTFFCDKCLK